MTRHEGYPGKHETRQTPPARDIEDFERTIERDDEELIQFSDGALGLLHRHEGQTVNWRNKWAPGIFNPSGVGIVKMDSGRRLALGRDTAVILPKLDTQTGKFATGEELDATRLETIAPDGILPPATIGQEWEPLKDQGEVVESVMFQYKISSPGTEQLQIGMPGYFDSAIEILEKADQQLPPPYS